MSVKCPCLEHRHSYLYKISTELVQYIQTKLAVTDTQPVRQTHEYVILFSDVRNPNRITVSGQKKVSVHDRAT